MTKNKGSFFIAILIFGFAALCNIAAQSTDQAALLQQMQFGSQAGTGSGLTGAAPTVAPQQPTVNQLSTTPAQPTPSATAQAPGTQAIAAQAAQLEALPLSTIEKMFALMASNLGTPAQNLAQFGYSLFEAPSAPSLASIGDDYILGPGDSLVLYLWGDPVDIKELSSSYLLTVDRNGTIFLPPVGQVSVWGQNLGSVKSVLKAMLDRRYKKLEMNLTLSTLRQFPVFVSGYAASPGTVLANGADTVLSVLSRAGGILKTGSLRSVMLTRQDKDGGVQKIEIDFYQSLLEGKPLDLRVREGDSIFIPGIGPVVALAGELKRPGIYELKGAPTMAQVLSFAGGMLPSSRSGSVTLLRFDAQGKILQTADVADKAFAELAAGDGDFVYFGRVSDLLLGQAQISGAVKYPGRYEVRSFKTLKELLEKAQLLPETNLFYGRVYRTDQSGRDKSFAFSPGEVLGIATTTKTKADADTAGSPLAAAGVSSGGSVSTPASDVALSEFDRVVLYRYDDTAIDADFDRFADTLVIAGPVKYPGFYLYKEGMMLSDLLVENPLLLDANPSYAEIVRRAKGGKLEYYTFSPEGVQAGKNDIALAQRDSIRFVKKGEQATGHDFDRFPDVVQLTGEVSRPEVYALRPGMKLSSVVTKDQVLLDTNLNYGEVTRLRVDGKHEYLTFRPGELLSRSYDLDLGPRDVIRLVKVGYGASTEEAERFSDAVRIEGPVEFGGSYAWREGMGLKELLGLAKPKLETNEVYAEIMRPLGGGKYEYVTFAPREVAAGEYDTALKAQDRVRLFTTAVLKVEPTRQSAIELQVSQTTGVGAETSAGTASIAPPSVGTGSTQVSPASTNAPASVAGQATPIAQATGPVGVRSTAASTSIETDTGLYLEVVYVSGTIRYQGPYARTPRLMLSSVVTPDQILQDTNLDYAELTRRKADGSWEYLTFSPRDVLNKSYDLPLRALDSINFVPVKYLPDKIDFDKFSNAIAIMGTANFPGLYSFSEPKMISKVIGPEQLLSTTDIYYGEIERWKEGGRREYLTFSPIAVFQGRQDFQILPGDIIRFVAAGDTGENHDFSKYPDTVLLKGSIRYPGRYAWYEGMQLSDIIQQQDLLIDTETSYAEIRRHTETKDTMINFAPDQVVAKKADVALSPRDNVMFYPKYYQKPVSIAGEVADPKIIPYYDQMELSSILRSVTLIRAYSDLKAEIKKITGETTVVYLESYLKEQPTSKIILSPGDSITIRALLPDEHLPVVIVRGEVKQPQTLPFVEGMKLADALTAAGGYDANAYPKGLVLIRKSVATAQQTQVDRLIAQLEAATAAGTSLPTSISSSQASDAASIVNMQVDLAMQKAKLGNLKQLYKEGFGRISLDIPGSLEKLSTSPGNIRLERDDLIYIPKIPTYVLVSGEVSSQNVVLYRDGMTVSDAITESGWLSGEADLAKAYIIRASGKLESTQGKGFLFFKPNILNYKLEPGDTVYVPMKSAKVSVAWAYVRDSFVLVSSILTSALTAKTLLGL